MYLSCKNTVDRATRLTYRWSGYYGEWGGLGEKAEGLEGGGAGEVAGVGGGSYRGAEGEVKKAGFSTFHIRRGDFQYPKVCVVGLVGRVRAKAFRTGSLRVEEGSAFAAKTARPTTPANLP